MTRKLAVSGALAAMAVMLHAASLSAGAAPPRCFGRTATIIGTNAGDDIDGTSRADVIVGRGGSDSISGDGGRDLICGVPAMTVPLAATGATT